MEEELVPAWRSISVKYIDVREIQSMLSKHASKLKEGFFCVILTLSNLQHCNQLRCRLIYYFFFGGLGNPFVFLCAQLPENPLRKYISIQDMDGNKEYFRCGLSVGAAGPLSSETFPLLAACAVGCSPAPHARSSSWNVAFGFGARGNRPVMI